MGKPKSGRSGYSSINASFVLVAFILISALFSVTFLSISSEVIDDLTNTYNRAVGESKTALLLSSNVRYNYSDDVNKLTFAVRLFEESSSLTFSNNFISFSLTVEGNASWSAYPVIDDQQGLEGEDPVEIVALVGERWSRDPVLEGNEIFRISIYLNRIGDGKPPLAPNDELTVEIMAPKGPGLDFSRTVPSSYSPPGVVSLG